MFVMYPKIKRLWTDEVEWILEHDVVIQEKLDGANVSIWMEDWILCMWSRTQVIYKWKQLKEFRWFQGVILNNKSLLSIFNQFPNIRLFWEYLVRHTIVYPVEYYNRFYLFDVMEDWDFRRASQVYELWKTFHIDMPKEFWRWRFTQEDIMKHVWEDVRGVAWEWVVIKSETFVNKFWDKCYAKIVHEQFKEANNVVFGNHFRDDVEWKFMSLYITPERVRKIVNKIEQNEWRSIVIQDTPRVMWTVIHDAFEEEMWWYSEKKTIDMGKLKKLCGDRTRFIFHNYLDTWEFLSWFNAITHESSDT